MKKILSIAVVFLLVVSAFAIFTSDVKATDIQFQMQPLVEGPADDLGPYILQDSSGKIWVFFQSSGRIDAPSYRHVFYITSVDGGITWTEPTLFLPAYVPGVDSINGPVAFQDSTGRFWVAWTNYYGVPDEDIIWFTTSTDGENWADAKVLCSRGNKIGNFMETGGKVWFFFSPCWPSWFQVSYKTTVDGGNGWSDVVPITEDNGNFYPHAIVLENGTIVVVYQHYPYTMHYCTSSDGGSTWSDATFDNPESDRDPRCVEYNGEIYVFFNRLYNDPFSHPHTTSDIWFRVSDETGWEPPQALTNEPQNSDNCATPARIRNQLWVVWGKASGDSYTPQDIWLARMFLKLDANINIDPDTLNLRSRGKWITAYIELPEGYDVADIDVSSIFLNETIPADPSAPITVGDHDHDGIPDLMVKFSRAEVISLILANVNIEGRFTPITLTMTGNLYDGMQFQGSDIIKTIMPMLGHWRFLEFC
jgi:hypothetical protein